MNANLFDPTAATGRISSSGPRAAALIVAAIVVSGLTQGPASASATPLDEFTESTIVGLDIVTPSLAMYADPGLASVAGGVRTTELFASAASDLANNVAFGIDTSGNGRLEYASGPLADGNLLLIYDGADLAADLGGTVGSIDVNFLTFDDGFKLQMNVTVVVSDGVDTADLTIPIADSSFDPFQLVFDLSTFSGIGPVDTTNLTSIELMFEARQGQDFALDSIHAPVHLPEPAALALFGLGGAIFIGTYGLRRRS